MSSNESKQQYSSGGVTPFLAKTYELVDNPETDNIIRWTPDGTSFIVLRTDLLEQELLPLKFKHSKFASFQRQLNQYSFRKTDPDSYTFTHQFFQRGRKDLLKNIQRKQNNHSGIRSFNQNYAQNVPNMNQNFVQHVPNGSQIYYVENQGNLPQKNNLNNNTNDNVNNGLEQDYSLVQQLEGLKKDKQLMTYEMDKMLQTQKSQQDVIQRLQKQVQKQDEILRSVVLFLSQGLRNPSIVQQFMMGGVGQQNQLVDQVQNSGNVEKNGFSNNSKKRRIEEDEDSEQSVEPVSNVQKSNQIIQYDPHYYDVFRCISQMWEQHNQQHQQKLYLEKQQEPDNNNSNNNDNYINNNQIMETPNFQQPPSSSQPQLFLENQQQKTHNQIQQFQFFETNQAEKLETQEDQINRQMSTLMIDANREVSWGIPVLTSLPMYHHNNDPYNMHALQNMQQQSTHALPNIQQPNTHALQSVQQPNMHAYQNVQQQNMHALEYIQTPAASYTTQSPNMHANQASGQLPANAHNQNTQKTEQVRVVHGEGTDQAHAVHHVHVPSTSPFQLQQLPRSEYPSTPMSIDQQNAHQNQINNNNQIYNNNFYQQQSQQQILNDISFMENDSLLVDMNGTQESELGKKEAVEKQEDKTFVFDENSDLLDFLNFGKDSFQTQDSLGWNLFCPSTEVKE